MMMDFPGHKGITTGGGRIGPAVTAAAGAKPHPADHLSGREIRLGGPLFDSRSPVLPRFLDRRRQILSVRLAGVRRAADPDPAEMLQLSSDIAYLNEMIARCSPEVEK